MLPCNKYRQSRHKKSTLFSAAAVSVMEPKKHKPIISTTLKAQHTEKDFGFADAG